MDAVNYKNGQKNHWRRTMWNAVAERTADKRNAVVLYLPGNTDLDRPEALRRGFMPWNLIAVERDKVVTKHLRARGVTTINADLQHVVAGWPSHLPCSVLIADFQCGIEPVVANVILAWLFNSALDSCMVLNLQRGRDSQFKYGWREMSNAISEQGYDGKNRGALMLGSVIDFLRKYGIPTKEHIAARLLPSYYSTEGRAYFDSVLFVKLPLMKEWVSKNDVVFGPSFHDMGGKIAAALAVRTMRMNGKLASA